jgi:hypothetical protein
LDTSPVNKGQMFNVKFVKIADFSKEPAFSFYDEIDENVVSDVGKY